MGITYQLKDICKITGISKRTLHFYDGNGLLPAIKKENGYRSYTQLDLEKLQIILFLKRLGMSLEEIKHFFTLSKKEQTKFVEKYQQKIKQKIKDLIETKEMLTQFLTGSSLIDVIKLKEPLRSLEEQYDTEAMLRYSKTREQQTYIQNNSKSNADEIKKQLENIFKKIAILSSAQLPTEMGIQNEIDKLYQLLFKIMGCSLKIFAAIGKEYVVDQRFVSFFEKYGVKDYPEYLATAMKYYVEVKGRE
ncbi:MerR family transcriptional regulator [Liquorilactobacillus hordei]|uniref:MerR family transcriptional regulator n=1 Tax=Liquorilactobacillus hordei TaxID=468911 RepID=UPI001CBF4728|nr:MerR family transcriptional regulator [Liquorilactobacillus hordei]